MEKIFILLLIHSQECILEIKHAKIIFFEIFNSQNSTRI
jgi:hypothetical protein